MDQINPERPELYRQSEAALGDADSIEKTTYAGNPHGAEPGDRPDQHARVTAQVRPGGSSPLFWATLVIALIVLFAFTFGVF